MFMMNEIAIGGMCAVLITVLSRDEKPIEDVKEMHEHNSRLYTMWTSAENPFLEAYSTVFVLRKFGILQLFESTEYWQPLWTMPHSTWHLHYVTSWWLPLGGWVLVVPEHFHFAIMPLIVEYVGGRYWRNFPNWPVGNVSSSYNTMLESSEFRKQCPLFSQRRLLGAWFSILVALGLTTPEFKGLGPHLLYMQPQSAKQSWGSELFHIYTGL